MKKTMRKVEIIFDLGYLVAGILAIIYIGMHLDVTLNLYLFIATILLIGGDFCHLAPRILSIINNEEEGNVNKIFKLKSYGMLISSLTLTIFYLILWGFGIRIFDYNNSLWNHVMYFLTIIRLVLTLLPQNKWGQLRENNKWSIYRNLPFILQGLMVIIFFFVFRMTNPVFSFAWLAVLLSFIFYIPVFLFVHKKPMIGMLMLPKTCMYLWLLWMFVQFV